MNTTVPEDDDPLLLDWCLFIAAHAREELVGTRRAFLRGARVELGREDDSFGPGALADGRVSRTHARLEVDASGALRVADLGSSNGTYVNGARIALVTLAPGDVLRLGGVLLVVQRASAAHRPARAALEGVGPALAKMQSAVERAASERGDVLVIEERGAGGARVAAAIHEARGGPMREWALGPWADRLPAGFDEDVRRSDGGTLWIRGIPPRGTLARGLLRERLAQPRGDSAPRRMFVVDASATADVELLQGLVSSVVRVPPLRERAEDLPFAARAWSAARDAPVPALSVRAWHALLRAPWPSNLAQLDATLDRARDALARGEPEDAEQWMLEAARGERAPIAPVAPLAPVALTEGEPAYGFAQSGRWFTLPAGERVSLHRREVLARVLGALVRARIEQPGRVVRAEQLIELAWPGERFIEGSGENRLHVALSNLRQLGLRPVIARVEDGYRIDPEAPARFVDE
jgi:hypothetical protein